MFDLSTLLGGQLGHANAAARAGDYGLLLGAGASIGAVNGRGVGLPAARRLVEMLADNYALAPIDRKGNLQRAYQRAVTSTSEENVWRFLKDVFGGATHESWFKHLSCLPWRRVWTLNIDDAFENAYAECSRAKVLPLRSIDWTEKFVDTNDLQLVHLHGRILGTQSTRLVFSFTEYQRAAHDRPVWDHVLGGALATRPMVIIGASLLDDPDVESLVLGNPPSANAPSIVVDPFIDDGNRWELEAKGFLVAKTTGAEFVDAWAQTFGLDIGGLDTLYAAGLVDIPQMERLQTNRVPPSPRTHDYLGGDEPLWSDACANRIAEFRWIRAEISAVQEWIDANDASPRLRLVLGNRLSGLSSGLLAVAREARRRGADVLMFDRSTRFSVPRVLDYCRAHGGSVLIVTDGVRDFADDFNELAIAAGKLGPARLMILGTDRKSEELKVDDRLTGDYQKHYAYVPRALSRDDGKAIVQKLAALGRLGQLERRREPDRLAHFSGRDIFSAMADVEHSPGFASRMRFEIQQLKVAWHRNLVLLLALASSENRQVGLLEASFAVSVPQDEIIRVVEHNSSLNALVERFGDVLLPRQRESSVSALVEGDGVELALRSLSDMVIQLAPLASPKSSYERNRAAILVGQLMNARNLARQFPGGDLDAFFERLRPTFGDQSARYWEQRAINARLSRDWPIAESFASRAVTMKDDAFTRTTLGVILLGRANETLRTLGRDWISFYRRGRDDLSNASISGGSAGGSRVSAFAYLENVLPILERIRSSSGDTELVAEVAEDWRRFYSYMRVRTVADDDSESMLRARQLQERYTALGLGD